LILKKYLALAIQDLFSFLQKKAFYVPKQWGLVLIF
jgi:hypothetical protein